MKGSPSVNKSIFIFGVPLGLMTSLCFLVKNSNAQTLHHLSLAVTIDFILIIPLIYFLSIKRTEIPKITVVPAMVLGLLLGSILLPKEDQMYFELFRRWILPLLELTVLFLVGIKVFKVLRVFKKENRSKADIYTTLREVCQDLFPKRISLLVATEIAVFYYGFLFWRKRSLQQDEFSYHKNNGTLSLIAAIIFIVGIETVVLHSVLTKWNVAIAWVVSLLSIYTIVQLFGFLKSIWDRPHKFEREKLYLRYGIMQESLIYSNDVASIELTSEEITMDGNVKRLSFLGNLEGHNVIIRLKRKRLLKGVYGTKKTYRTLLLFVDNKVEFKNRLESNGC